MRKADVVLITDGVSSESRAAELKVTAEKLGASVLGIGIGIPATALRPWCHQAISITDVDRLEDRVAETLFTI